MSERDPIELDAEAEAEAAAAEAAAIGGPDPDGGVDPAERPVREGGGGEAEGFELAEEDLREHASHGRGAPDPAREAFSPEAESDRQTGVAGEADSFRSSERDEDG
jgi:hypothetical protein